MSKLQPNWLARQLLGFILAVVFIVLVTAFLFLLRDGLNTSTVARLYLAPILVNTSLLGLWPEVFSAGAID